MFLVPERQENTWLISGNEKRRGIIGPLPQWKGKIESQAIQPQRVLQLSQLNIGAEKNVEFKIDITIYADSLSSPIRQELFIDLTVKTEVASALKIIEVIRDTEKTHSKDAPLSEG